MIPPTPGDRRGARASSPAQMRNPAERLADLRAQRAANLTGAKRVAELVERLGRERAARRHGRDPRLRRAPQPGGDRASSRTASYEADRSARGRSGRRPGRRAARAATSTGSACGSTSRAAPTRSTGNLNCPLAVTKSAAFFAVRVLTDPDAPPCAGAPPADRGRAPRGLRAQRPLAGGRGRRQRRDVEPGRRPGARGARRGHRRARAGPGDDEQLHPRG